MPASIAVSSVTDASMLLEQEIGCGVDDEGEENYTVSIKYRPSDKVADPLSCGDFVRHLRAGEADLSALCRKLHDTLMGLLAPRSLSVSIQSKPDRAKTFKVACIYRPPTRKRRRRETEPLPGDAAAQ